MEIVVGKKVFLRPTGNLARYNKSIREATIAKIGRKYFYVDDEKFEIETLKNINEDCNSAWILYFSKQKILDEDEKRLLLNKFSKLFHWSGKGKELTLEQLKQMADVANLE